jgi:predicted Rossmann fold flavoprotein
MQRERYDVVVIGGGAAGLLAATRAASRGRRTLLLEKNARPGVKILMSGGTRCNITNARDRRGIVEAFGPGGRFLFPSLGELDSEAVRRLFHDAGCPTKVEDDVVPGKVFPASDRATDVLDALLRGLERSGAELAAATPASGLEPLTGGGFAVDTPRGRVRAEAVVVTVGGASYPRAGTAGDGYRFAARMGHAIVEPLPALVPLVVAEPWIRELRGLAVDARARTTIGGRRVGERDGAVLFTHFGLSGPAVLDASSALVRARRASPGVEAVVELDFLPGEEEARVEVMLREAAQAAGGRLVKNALAPPLPERLAGALVRDAARVEDSRRLAALSKEERRRVARAVKGLRLRVAGDRGFAQAEVTSGGVVLDEVDPRTLASKKQAGLYFAGEVLDLDGPIGGFNFQAAWSTGWLAGGVA